MPLFVNLGRVIFVVGSFPPGSGMIFRGNIPKKQTIAIAQRSGLHRPAVHHGFIGGFKVRDREIPGLIQLNNRMVTGSSSSGKDDIISTGTANGKGGPIQDVFGMGTIGEAKDEFWRHRDIEWGLLPSRISVIRGIRQEPVFPGA